MDGYRFLAIGEATAEKVRTTRKSPGYGHPVHAEIATGYGPCRLCLRDFNVGTDRRLLFTLDPFYGLEPFPLPGPDPLQSVRDAANAMRLQRPEPQWPRRLQATRRKSRSRRSE